MKNFITLVLVSKVQNVKLGYTVKYPKMVTLQFKKMRAINCPSF